MPESYAAPTGTRDVLAPESSRWETLVARFAAAAGRSGFGLALGPMFEDRGVFVKAGDATDVVRKEMYELEDRGGRPLALRPEGTPSIVRAWVQHRPTLPWKAWYAAPNFRYERPQAGRFRQHHQMGAEVLGSEDADVDVEVIALAWDLLEGLGLRRVLLLINSLGDRVCRPAYMELLRAYVGARQNELCDEHRGRWKENPLRVLDCKRKACREATRSGPRMVDHLCAPCEDHFARVQEGLGALEIPFAIETRLVRGLDYYTRTTFEFQASALESSQDAVGGGGRYDGLVEMMGGPPTPGVGFGLGIERILLACDAEEVFPIPVSTLEVYVVDTTGGQAARDLSATLRRAGIATDRSFDGRSMKAQFKQADRSGARFAVVVGPDELATGKVKVQDLYGEGTELVERHELLAHFLARRAGDGA